MMLLDYQLYVLCKYWNVSISRQGLLLKFFSSFTHFFFYKFLMKIRMKIKI